MPKINREALNDLRLPMPSKREQAKICAHLATETHTIDAIVTIAEKSMELLLERRSALISAAVTGKIDVRGVTADIAEAAA
jgi:type I restriction enzyme S subunit